MLTDWKLAYVRRGQGTKTVQADGAVAEAADGEILEAAVRFYEGDLFTEKVGGKDTDVYRRTAALDAGAVVSGATGKLVVYRGEGSSNLTDIEILIKQDVAASSRTPIAEQVLTTADADRAGTVRRAP